MRRLRNFMVLLGCASLVGLVACSDDDGGNNNTTCGDGIIQTGEQCEIGDVNGQTCADVVPGSTGTLACNAATCNFDTAGCMLCGDGLKTFGEDCDCGTDAANLPTGCTDVNGGATANCDASCNRISRCGDGVRDTGEACDCGDSVDVMPNSCDAINGGAGATCDTDCTTIGAACTVDPYGECVIGAGTDNPCCNDSLGSEHACINFGGTTSYCIIECTDTLDCYLGSECYSNLGGCYASFCAMDSQGNPVPSQLNQPCMVGGGGEGYCVPAVGRADETDGQVGVCVENTSNDASRLGFGDPCLSYEDVFSPPRDAPGVCENGLCFANSSTGTIYPKDGTCSQFCNWEEAYDAAFNGGTEAMPCPDGTNCFAFAYHDPDKNYLNSSGWGYCEDIANITSCSVMTGELLSDPNQTCDDVAATNEYGVCIHPVIDDTTTPATSNDAQLLGFCISVPATDYPVPTLGVWDTCDNNSTHWTKNCPLNTICMRTDEFAASPTGAYVCAPWCDTEVNNTQDASCLTLGADPVVTGGATEFTTCNSYTLLLNPDETRLSRNGFCQALP